jgi:uroporphyrinogen decarboxylase
MNAELSPKERLCQAIAHQTVDRIPTQVNYTDSMGQLLAGYLGVPVKELNRRLGNHLARLDLPAYVDKNENLRYDWWGVGWSLETEGYWPVKSPLAQSENLDEFTWPDPDAADLMEGARQTLVQDGGEHFAVPNFGFALYERAWSLRGFEKFNIDLATNPGYVADLLDRITSIQVALARRYVALGVDGGYFGDDYGAQKGMLFSPRTWRAVFKPRLAQMFAVFKDAGLPVILHSDGDIAPIVPDLIEIGLSMLNPVQPEVVDHAWLKNTFGGRLAFYGGISTQTVLPYGTPDEVRTACRKTLEGLSDNGSGLLLAPSHRMTADIPIENVAAMLESFSVL